MRTLGERRAVLSRISNASKPCYRERCDLEGRYARRGRRSGAQLLDEACKFGFARLGDDVNAVVAVEHPAGDGVLRSRAIHERAKADALNDAGDAQPHGAPRGALYPLLT